MQVQDLGAQVPDQLAVIAVRVMHDDQLLAGAYPPRLLRHQCPRAPIDPCQGRFDYAGTHAGSPRRFRRQNAFHVRVGDQPQADCGRDEPDATRAHFVADTGDIVGMQAQRRDYGLADLVWRILPE